MGLTLFNQSNNVSGCLLQQIFNMSTPGKLCLGLALERPDDKFAEKQTRKLQPTKVMLLNVVEVDSSEIPVIC